jgi:nucleoid-associated protein YgaU
MKFNLKKFLKTVKLNEENISMVLGALVIVIIGMLIVNYFKDKRSQTLPEALSTQNQTQNGKTHTVVKGETLWSIAEDVYGSGYNWSDIYNTNKLNSQNLEVGQVLTLPQIAAKQPTETKTVSVTKVEPIKESTKITAAEVTQLKTVTITENNYTVTKGDFLWSIAVRAYGDGYKWVNIAKANKLTNPNVIHPGNVLVLPR